MISELGKLRSRILANFREGIEKNGGIENGNPFYQPLTYIYSIDENLKRCSKELKRYTIPAEAPEPGSEERAPDKPIYKMRAITAQEVFKFLDSLGYAEKKQDRRGSEQFYVKGKDFSMKGRILGFVLDEAIGFIVMHPEKSISCDPKNKITDSFYALKKPGNILPDKLTDAATRSRDKIMRLDSTLREKLHDAVLKSLS